MRLVALFVVFGLAGCAQIESWRFPEVVACETFTKSLLKAPATYKRARALISDSQLPLDYWREDTKSIASSVKQSYDFFAEVDKSHFSEGGVRSVLIEYDASNGFGVPTRGTSSCKFEVLSFANNKFRNEPSSSGAEVDIAMLKAGLAPKEKTLVCCETNRTAVRLEKYAAQEKFLSSRELK